MINEKTVAVAFSNLNCSNIVTDMCLEQSLQSTQGANIPAFFTSAALCREQSYTWESSIAIIVNNKHVGEITPINLAAALCIDCPERDIYLMDDDPSEAVALSARKCGIRGVVNRAQVDQMLSQENHEADQAILCMKPEVQFIHSASPSELCSNLPSITYVEPSSESLSGAHANQSIEANADLQSSGRVIGFFSGRGGVGKSTLALMSALSAQVRGLNTALIDLDLQFGDIAFLAGREHASHIQRVSMEQACFDKRELDVSDNALLLIQAPEKPEDGERYIPTIEGLLQEISSQKDLVIVNTGSFWTGIHAVTLKICSQVAILMDQRATSIEACKQVTDLCTRMQIPQASLVYLLNGCGRGAAFTPQDVSLALGGYEVYGIADGGTLVDELLSLGCPMELLASSNALILSLENLLDKVIGECKGGLKSNVIIDPLQEKKKFLGAEIFRRFFERSQHVAT